MSYANEGRISVNMSANTKERLDRIAEARGMTRNALIVELIETLPEPKQKR
jgi:predicted DNA-binding protein